MKDANTVDIENVAKFILLYCNKNEIEINHFKLQKLLYYTQAWHLVYFDNKQIFNELPQAWVNGPVYRSVYNSWRHIYAATGIKVEAKHSDEIEAMYQEAYKNLAITSEQELYLNSILYHYGLMSHEKLIFLTHREDPWNIAREGLGVFDYSEKVISAESMFNYYSKILSSSNKNSNQA